MGVCKLLLEHGVDVDGNDRDGRTPLCEAAWSGHVEASKVLLENGADVNVKVNGGGTPMFWPTLNGNTEICNLLKEYGAEEIQWDFYF